MKKIISKGKQIESDHSTRRHGGREISVLDRRV